MRNGDSLDMTRIRRLAWVLVSATVGAILAGELFARFYLGLGQAPLSQPHPTIEYLFKPNQKVRPFGNLFQTNRYGMRSADFEPQKTDPRELRVMMYGDSVINGGNLSDQAQLASTYVQAGLARQLRRPVVVGNISAGSWGPPNELAYLKQYGFLDADIVTLVLSSSDYDDAPTFEPLNPLTHPTVTPVSALWDGINRYLPRYIGGPTINESGPLPEARHIANKRDVEVSLGAEREFLQMAKAAGVKVVLVQHWTRSELSSGRPLEGYAVIRRVATDENVPILDDAGKLRAFLKSGKNPYRDDIHLNDNGQLALAELLLDAFTQDFADVLVPERTVRCCGVSQANTSKYLPSAASE